MLTHFRPRPRPASPTSTASAPLFAAAARLVLVAHLALSPLLFGPDWGDGFEAVKSVWLEVAAVALLALGIAHLVGCILIGPSADFPRPRALLTSLSHPVAMGVLLLLLSAAVSTATSVSPLTSWRGYGDSHAGLRTGLAYTVLFLATWWTCRHPADARRLVAVVVPAGALAAGYAGLQVAHLDPLAWRDVSVRGGSVRPFGPLGHPNFLAAYLVLALPLVVYFAGRAWSGHRLTAFGLLGGVAGLIAGVAVATRSRGGWLALAAVCACLLVWALLRTGWRKPAVLALVALGLAASAGTVAVAAGARAFPDTSVRNEGRWYVWGGALAIARERPWFGCGPDAFALAYLRHRTPDGWRAEAGRVPTRAHNEALHILATQGAVGLAALLVLAGGLVASTVRAWRRGEPTERSLVVALAAALVGFTVQSAFSFTVVGCGTLAVTCAALLARMSVARDPVRVDGEPTTSPALWTVLALGVGVLVAWPTAHAELTEGEGQRWLAAGPARALACLERATVLGPENAGYWAAWGDALASRAEGSDGLRRARRAFERAHELVPGDPAHSLRLGKVLGELAHAGEAPPADAFAAFEAALAGDPSDPAVYAEAARAALALDDLDRLDHYTAEGLRRFPQHGPIRAFAGHREMRRRQYGAACEYFRTALEGDGWEDDSDGFWATCACVGATQESIGDYGPALRTYRQVLAARPDLRPVREAVERLTHRGEPGA